MDTPESPNAPTPFPTPPPLIAPESAPAPVPDLSGRPERPSLAAVRERRRLEREGIPFHFLSTVQGFYGTVRRLSLADRSAAAIMPTEYQDRVVFQLNKNNARNANARPDDALTMKRLNEANEGNEALANAFFVAGCVSPRIVEDPALANEEADVWFVGDIHLTDRLNYLAWCQSQDETAGGRIEPFRLVAGGPLVRVAPPALDYGTTP